MIDYDDSFDWSGGENGGEEWLPKTGTHIVKVVASRMVYANSGNVGIEITLADRHGRKVKDALWNTPKSISRNWKICTFMGMPPDVIKHIKPEVFVGRYCKVTTAADGNYTKIDQWEHWAPKDKSEAFDPVLKVAEPEQWTPETANNDTPFKKDNVPF